MEYTDGLSGINEVARNSTTSDFYLKIQVFYLKQDCDKYCQELATEY